MARSTGKKRSSRLWERCLQQSSLEEQIRCMFNAHAVRLFQIQRLQTCHTQSEAIFSTLLMAIVGSARSYSGQSFGTNFLLNNRSYCFVCMHGVPCGSPDANRKKRQLSATAADLTGKRSATLSGEDCINQEKLILFGALQFAKFEF